MGKRLVIAEKPSVARDIAASLGGFQDHGESFESEDLVITWAVGHLLQLAEPREYDKAFASWSIKNLPILPAEFRVVPREGQKKRLDAIAKLANRKDVDGIVNACDAGREGELIFRRVYEYAGTQKPFERLWLQSMTADAIRDGFEHLRPGHDLDGLGDAAWLRSVGDWLVGMNATRALTQRLKSRGEKDAWSAGRVQTPTLKVLVDREREILAHVPRPYWELVGRFSHEGVEWEGRFWDADAKTEEDPESRGSRLFDRARVERLLHVLTRRSAGIASEKRRKSRQSAPLLFDLTSLQREMNRRSSLSAKRTLDAAQRLYEGHKLLTYPRTDSRYLPGDYGPEVTRILGALAEHPTYGGIAQGIQGRGPQNLDRMLDSSKVSDHFAIIPTGALPERELTGDDARVFDLVCRQFMAAMMEPAVWSHVERVVEVDARDEKARFRTTARTLEVPGFLEALGREAGEGKDLPPLVPGRDEADGVGVRVDAIADEEKETRPPTRYSEAQLLRMMETAGQLLEEDDLSDAMKDRGLGTPATRADTIEGLIQKQYARRVESRLAPTSKAMRLMDILERVDVPTLASPALTGEWEHMLKKVEERELDRGAMLDRFTAFTKEMVDHLVGFEHDKLYAGDPDLGPCPSCKEGRVVESAWGYRCSRNTGPDSPCNLIIWKDRAGRYIDRKTAETLVRDGRTGSISGFVDRFGRQLTGTLELVKDPETGRWMLQTEFGKPTDGGEEEVRGALWPCPVHGDCEIVETNLRYVCRKLLDAEIRKDAPVLPRVVCHREIEPEEAAAYFAGEGKTPYLESFISKRGRPFTGALFRKPTGKHGFEFPPREGGRGARDEATDEAEGAVAKTATGRKKPTRKAGNGEAAKEPAATKSARKPGARKAAAEAPAAEKGATKKAAVKKTGVKKTTAKKVAPKAASAK